MTRTWKSVAVAAVAASLVIASATACGDDDPDTATPSATTAADGFDSVAYCEASVAVESAGEPDVDFETASPDEIATAIQTFAADTLLPLVDEAIAAAPPELDEEAQVMRSALQQLADTGDSAAVETPEFKEAEQTVHAFDVETCGWRTVEVVTRDYTFEGIPSQLPAGPTTFDMTNEGTDVHEVVVLRKNAGVTESVEQLLELPDDEVETKIQIVGVAGPVPSGEEAYVFADLAPGNYIAICFLPVGMTSMDGPPPEGQPHFMSGMVTEFTVT
jgi:hypothetical protein